MKIILKKISIILFFDLISNLREIDLSNPNYQNFTPKPIKEQTLV